MTTAITRQAIRRELYNQVPGLGFSGTADSVAGTSITDAFALRDSTLGQNHYRGMYLYRPDLSTDDRIKKATTLVNTTGALSHGGSTYVDQADLDYEIVGVMHPDELNACIQRAMQRIFLEVQVPLSPEITDGDMDANNTTSWSDVGTPATKAKTTTGSRVFSGIRALRVLNDAVDEGVQSTTIRGFPTNSGERVYVSAVVHVDVGTANLILYDVTNAANIRSVTSTEEGWAHLWLQDVLPTGAEEIAIRLTGTQSNADLYWSHVVVYRLDSKRLAAPSWLDEPYKLIKLRETHYGKSLSSQTNGGYDDATSRYFSDWLQPSMFSLEPLHLDTNPYEVQLTKPLPLNELWIHGKRPFSDLEDLSTDASTTLAPARQVYAYSKDELAKVLMKRYSRDNRWVILLNESMLEIEAETKARPELPARPIKREHYGRI